MSFQSFSDSAEPEHSSGGDHALLLRLITAVATHSGDVDAEEHDHFCSRLTDAGERIKQATDSSGVNAAVESILHTIEEHGTALQVAHEAAVVKLKRALRMMTDSMAQLGNSNQAAVDQLSVVEKMIEEVIQSQDPQQLKHKLGHCLHLIREHSRDLRAQSEVHVTRTKSMLGSMGESHDEDTAEIPVEPVTELPARAYAEKLIHEYAKTRARSLVGIFVVNRLAGIEGKYGRDARDEVMRNVSKHLKQKLPESSVLCSWSEHALVSITDLSSGGPDAEHQLRKIGQLQLEKSIDAQSRSVFLLLTASYLAVELGPRHSKRAIIQRLEEFAERHAAS